MSTKSNILFVCLGNICRSPTAEAVFRRCAASRGVPLTVDSAGTIAYHQGKLPDARACRAAEARGFDFSGITSRPVCVSDFSKFSHVLAMDKQNLEDLKRICPVDLQHKLALFLSVGTRGYEEVPDPYYGDDEGFERVLDLIVDASEQWLNQLHN